MKKQIKNHNHQLLASNFMSGGLGNNVKTFFGVSYVRSGGKECENLPLCPEVLGIDKYPSISAFKNGRINKDGF